MPAPAPPGAIATLRRGKAIGRSEGLALASLDMFASGAFSGDTRDPFRVDADSACRSCPIAALDSGFQVSADNPLVGLDGRADLLRRLGRLVAERADIFGRATRRGRAVCSIISSRGNGQRHRRAAPSCPRC